MRRAAVEKHRTRQTWRRHLATHGAKILCECELQPGGLRKSQRVGGCGRSRCYLCHFAKLTGQPTIRDLKSLAAELEGLAEIEAANSAVQRDVFGPSLRALRRPASPLMFEL